MAVEFKEVSSRDALVLNRLVSELIAGDIVDVSGRTMLTMPWQTRGKREATAEESA